MTITQTFDEWKSNLPQSMTQEQESQLIYHIIETADHLTPDNIARHILSPASAWDLVSNDDDMWETALANAPKDLAHRAVANDSDRVDKLAYMLAYEHPNTATRLLNELLYYREQGRI